MKLQLGVVVLLLLDGRRHEALITQEQDVCMTADRIWLQEEARVLLCLPSWNIMHGCCDWQLYCDRITEQRLHAQQSTGKQRDALKAALPSPMSTANFVPSSFSTVSK